MGHGEPCNLFTETVLFASNTGSNVMETNFSLLKVTFWFQYKFQFLITAILTLCGSQVSSSPNTWCSPGIFPFFFTLLAYLPLPNFMKNHGITASSAPQSQPYVSVSSAQMLFNYSLCVSTQVNQKQILYRMCEPCFSNQTLTQNFANSLWSKL